MQLCFTLTVGFNYDNGSSELLAYCPLNFWCRRCWRRITTAIVVNIEKGSHGRTFPLQQTKSMHCGNPSDRLWALLRINIAAYGGVRAVTTTKLRS